MATPFQRLLFCSKKGQRQLNIILAASGPSIRSFNASNGVFLSKWSHLDPTRSLKVSNGHDEDLSPGGEVEEPPEKRRKFSPSREPSEAPSAEIIVESPNSKRRKPKPLVQHVPFVTSLCSSNDGRHVVAVTGEDKCIRVLRLLPDGSLTQLSERVMPKRPCAIVLTTDQETIICADKFGDVYALPLLIAPKTEQLDSEEVSNLPSKSNTKPTSSTYVPTANSSTVHTKKNLIALKSQQSIKNTTKEKKVYEFKHQLLLGHVSLLTDLAYVTIQDGATDKSYILSSDRDEHIRVSRGIPQAHVIERFCLGHSQFISKICCPSWCSNILISGGGDNFLIIWNWLKGEIRQHMDLRDPIRAVRDIQDGQLLSSNDVESDVITVSGIWAVNTGSGGGEIIVTLERVPAILIYTLDKEGVVSHHQTLPTQGNVLDVGFCHDDGLLVYSIDNVHQSWTKTVSPEQSQRPYIGAYRCHPIDLTWKEEGSADWVRAINVRASAEEGTSLNGHSVSLGDLFYGIEHLRKLSTDDAEESVQI